MEKLSQWPLAWSLKQSKVTIEALAILAQLELRGDTQSVNVAISSWAQGAAVPSKAVVQ